jgi:hypothetical protein
MRTVILNVNKSGQWFVLIERMKTELVPRLDVKEMTGCGSPPKTLTVSTLTDDVGQLTTSLRHC